MEKRKDADKYYGWDVGDIQILPTKDARKILKKDPKKDDIDEDDKITEDEDK